MSKNDSAPLPGQISIEEYLDSQVLTAENLLEETERLRARLIEYNNLRGDQLINVQNMRLKRQDELAALEAEVAELGKAELYLGDVWQYLSQALYYQGKSKD